MLYSLAHLALAVGVGGLGVAVRLLRRSVGLWPDHPSAAAWLTYLEGVRAMRCGDPDTASALLKHAAAALPDVTVIRANLGIAHALNGAFDDAIYNIENVFKEGSSLVHAAELWTALVWSYLRTGRVPKAREAFQRAAEHDVSAPRLELLSALADGMQAAALPTEHIGRLLRSTPSTTPMVLEYAEYLARTGKRQLARQLVESLPRNSWGQGYHVLAYSSLNADDVATASWAAARCEQLADDAQAAAMLRSEIALREGRADDALLEARRALEAGDKTSEVHEQLGKALLMSGNWAEAVEQMIEALHNGPASALAAGLAALASIGTGDYMTARGLFAGRRTGDGLGVACAHVAQCRIMQHDGKCEEAMKLASWALDELEQLPDCLSFQPLIERLGGELEFALERLDTDDRERLGGLQDRVSRVSASRPSHQR